MPSCDSRSRDLELRLDQEGYEFNVIYVDFSDAVTAYTAAKPPDS